ncbi:MAG TPA: hypothetical protein PK467_16510, partial [Candidatus Wallbacteria bacterium]|nr:hypothetical protein [Candidatus Wallbacteria bacterium]
MSKNNNNGGGNNNIEKKPGGAKKSFVHSFAVFLIRYRAFLFYSFIILAMAGSVFIKNIKIDNSIELWFLENDLTLKAYN